MKFILPNCGISTKVIVATLGRSEPTLILFNISFGFLGIHGKVIVLLFKTGCLEIILAVSLNLSNISNFFTKDELPKRKLPYIL
jgi:hypothetical protein